MLCKESCEEAAQLKAEATHLKDDEAHEDVKLQLRPRRQQVARQSN